MVASLVTITDQLSRYYQNFTSQLTHSASSLTVQDYLRLVVIVGGYALLRPYLIKLGARFQSKDHERELDPGEMSSTAAAAVNSLKGTVHVPEDTDSESEGEGRRGTDWGKKARRRQREMIRELLDVEEERRKAEQEAESDKEIEQFLVG